MYGSPLISVYPTKLIGALGLVVATCTALPASDEAVPETFRLQTPPLLSPIHTEPVDDTYVIKLLATKGSAAEIAVPLAGSPVTTFCSYSVLVVTALLPVPVIVLTIYKAYCVFLTVTITGACSCGDVPLDTAVPHVWLVGDGGDVELLLVLLLSLSA